MRSVHSRILDAMLAKLQALPELQGGTFKVRKKPYWDRERGETLPLICLCPQTEKLADINFENSGVMDYPVVVVIARAGDLLLDDPRDLLDLRATVRQGLADPDLDGADELIDSVAYDPAPPFDTSALDASLDASLQGFTYRADEPLRG